MKNQIKIMQTLAKSKNINVVQLEGVLIQGTLLHYYGILQRWRSRTLFKKSLNHGRGCHRIIIGILNQCMNFQLFIVR